MLTADDFIKDVLVDALDLSVERSIENSLDELVKYEYNVSRISSVISQSEYDLQFNTVDVIAVSFDRLLLERADETVLDGTELNWRTAANDTPRHFLYRGEITHKKLRLHPPPSTIKPIHILHSIRPQIGQLVAWQNLFVIIRSIGVLSISDPMRTRPKVKEFTDIFLGLITKDLKQ